MLFLNVKLLELKTDETKSSKLEFFLFSFSLCFFSGAGVGR